MILNDVTATLSTRGRSETTLPMVLTSILSQTYKPGKVVIYDDNDRFDDPNKIEVLRNVLAALIASGVPWFWEPGARKGQIHNHEKALRTATTPFIWRLDDDNIMPSNTLEELYKIIVSDAKIGAVGPSIIDPKNRFNTGLASNKIADIYLGLNVQWNECLEVKLLEVEHLQGSTFVYRVEAAKHGYDLSLSRKGHREETIFTYEMFRAGWKLIAATGINTWHFHYGSGGIRSEKDNKMFSLDEARFNQKLHDWGVTPNQYKIIFLDSGRGDHYAFKTILPELVEKYKNYKFIIAVCYPDCFWDITDENITFCSLKDALAFVNPEHHNVYMFMEKNNWKVSLVEAYRRMYL